MSNLSIGVRSMRDAKSQNILKDQQIAIDSPTSAPSCCDIGHWVGVFGHYMYMDMTAAFYAPRRQLHVLRVQWSALSREDCEMPI